MKNTILLIVITALLSWLYYHRQIWFWRGMYHEESKYSSYLYDLFYRTNDERLRLLREARQNAKERHHD